MRRDAQDTVMRIASSNPAPSIDEPSVNLNSIGAGLKVEHSAVASTSDMQMRRSSTHGRNVFQEYTSASDDISNGKTSAGGHSNKKDASNRKRFNMAKYVEVFGTDPYINSNGRHGQKIVVNETNHVKGASKSSNSPRIKLKESSAPPSNTNS